MAKKRKFSQKPNLCSTIQHPSSVITLRRRRRRNSNKSNRVPYEQRHHLAQQFDFLIIRRQDPSLQKLTFSIKKKVKIAFFIKRRRLLKQYESGSSSSIEDLSLKGVLFYTTTHDNIQGLCKRMKDLISGVKEIHGLEAKILAVLFKGEEELNFKNKEDENKKSFFQLLMEFDKSDYEWDIVDAIKAVAAFHGIKLTSLLLEFMLLASDSDATTKFGVLKSALKRVIEGEKSVVVARVIAVLDWVDSETNFEELEEDIIDRTILVILNTIMRMEFFWMHRGLPCEKGSMNGEYKSMEYELDQWNMRLMIIESDIREMRGLSAFDFQGDDQNLERKDLCLKIEKLWDHIEDSEF